MEVSRPAPMQYLRWQERGIAKQVLALETLLALWHILVFGRCQPNIGKLGLMNSTDLQ